MTIFYAVGAEKREAGCAGGPPPEYYPVKLPRPSRCNPFKANALKAYEDFLAERDIGVSYTGFEKEEDIAIYPIIITNLTDNVF